MTTRRLAGLLAAALVLAGCGSSSSSPAPTDAADIGDFYIYRKDEGAGDKGLNPYWDHDYRRSLDS